MSRVIINGSASIGGDVVGGNKIDDGGFKSACDLVRRFIKEKISRKENPWPASELLSFEEALTKGKVEMIMFRNRIQNTYNDSDFVVRSIQLVIMYL